MAFEMNTTMTKGDRPKDYGPSWQRGAQSPIGIQAHIDELQTDSDGKVDTYSAARFLEAAWGGVDLTKGDRRVLRRVLTNHDINLDSQDPIGRHNLEAFGLPEKITRGTANELETLSRSLSASLRPSPLAQLSEQWGGRIGAALAAREGGRPRNADTDTSAKPNQSSKNGQQPKPAEVLARALPRETIVT